MGVLLTFSQKRKWVEYLSDDFESSALIADTGYCSQNNVNACKEARIEPLLSVARQDITRTGVSVLQSQPHWKRMPHPCKPWRMVTYDVVVNVDNPGQILLPGMTAYVNIAVAERKDVLLVPNAALRYKPADSEIQKLPANAGPAANQGNDAGKSGASRPGASPDGKPKDAKQSSGQRDTFAGKVFVLKNGKLKPLSVMSGITDNRNTEIAGGDLKAGDLVVIGEAQADQSKSSGSRPMRLF